MPTPAPKVHVFEQAGLGKAPYRFVGYARLVFRAAPDCPAQPGAACDYCGTGIMDVYYLRGADGREFKVGCDCIAKSGDAGLKRVVSEREREKRYERKREKEAPLWAAVKAARERLDTDAALIERLDAQPHPMGFTDRVTGQPLTLRDWAWWMLHNAGLSGMTKAAKVVNDNIPKEA